MNELSEGAKAFLFISMIGGLALLVWIQYKFEILERLIGQPTKAEREARKIKHLKKHFGLPDNYTEDEYEEAKEKSTEAAIVGFVQLVEGVREAKRRVKNGESLLDDAPKAKASDTQARLDAILDKNRR